MIDINKSTTAELVAFYNANSGKSPIRKFADRKTAEARCAALIPATTKKKTGGSVTKVIVNGTEYKSTGAAFNALKLPAGRLIKFRMALKAAGKLDFEHGDKKVSFKVAA
jgi:hypothetical protein